MLFILRKIIVHFTNEECGYDFLGLDLIVVSDVC